MTSALITMLSLALCSAVARGGDEAAYATALDAIDQLQEDGETEAARALAEWIAAQPDAGSAGERSAAFVDATPDRASNTWPKVRLIAWEAAYGSFTLGGGTGFGYFFDDAPAAYPALALAGGAIGTTGAVFLSRRADFHTGHVHALVGTQQLVTANALALAALAEDEKASGWGIIGGGVLGTGLGVAWALSEPDPVRTLGFHSGALWGFGLATLATGYAYKFDALEEKVPLVMAGGADLGAGIGYLLPVLLPVRADHIRMANAGGFIGAGVTFAFINLTSNIIWYTPHSVAAIVGGAGLAGGALGVALAERMNTPRLPVAAGMFEAHGATVRLALPVPRAFPVPGQPGDVAWGVNLVDQQF